MLRPCYGLSLPTRSLLFPLVPFQQDTFSINYPNDHLVCYSVTGGSPATITVIAEDQFGPNFVDLGTPELLCEPSEKEIPTPAIDGTWGKVKSIYR